MKKCLGNKSKGVCTIHAFCSLVLKEENDPIISSGKGRFLEKDEEIASEFCDELGFNWNAIDKLNLVNKIQDLSVNNNFENILNGFVIKETDQKRSWKQRSFRGVSIKNQKTRSNSI